MCGSMDGSRRLVMRSRQLRGRISKSGSHARLVPMPRYRSFRDLDWPLLAISLLICALGVLQIYSATHDTKWRDAWWKQILWVGIALGIMWVVTSIDYHSLLGQVPILYGLSIASLVAIFAVGKLVFG